MHHTYYRGCWHVVSRCFGQVPSFSSSLPTALYNPKAFITHAASLRQGFPHCARFLTAASRRSLGRISVPMWPITLSGRLSIVAMVGSYPTIKLMERRLIYGRPKALSSITYYSRIKIFEDKKWCWTYAVLAPVSRSCPPSEGRLPTCYSPVRHSSAPRRARYRSTCMFKTRRQR